MLHKLLTAPLLSAVVGGDPASGVPEPEGGDEGVDPPEEAAETETANFMPPVQWPGVEQMKYMSPGEVKLILVLPSSWAEMTLVVAQLS